METFYILFNADSPECEHFADWCGNQSARARLEFLPVSPARLKTRLPYTDIASPETGIVVVTENGETIRGDAAWAWCIWALDGYESLARRVASPQLLPLARSIALLLSRESSVLLDFADGFRSAREKVDGTMTPARAGTREASVMAEVAR